MKMKILKIIEWMCTIPILLLALYAVVTLILWGIGYSVYVVQSGSMEPAIRTGSLAMTDLYYPFENIREGDVVVYEKGDMLVVHRVISVSGEGFETKGDANSQSDGISVTSDNYKGKVIKSVPWLGYLNSALHSFRGKVICLLWAASLYMAGTYAVYLQEKREEYEGRHC